MTIQSRNRHQQISFLTILATTMTLTSSFTTLSRSFLANGRTTATRSMSSSNGAFRPTLRMNAAESGQAEVVLVGCGAPNRGMGWYHGIQMVENK